MIYGIGMMEYWAAIVAVKVWFSSGNDLPVNNFVN